MIKLESYLTELKEHLCTKIYSTYGASRHMLMQLYLDEIDYNNTYYYPSDNLCIIKQFYRFSQEYSFNDQGTPTLSVAAIFELLVSHYEDLQYYIATKYLLHMGYSYIDKELLDAFALNIDAHKPNNLDQGLSHLSEELCLLNIF